MTTAVAPALPGQKAYRPYGAARAVFYNKQPEILVSGPAGTGKSRSLLEKLHLCAEKYAGMRGLILRKTRASLTQSALQTFETKVVPDGHPILGRVQRESRRAYRYPNGSEIVVGGLDNPDRVMSTEYDVAYIQEATECTEEDWEKITTRLRNGVMPYQQLLADCNPDSPSHWLYQRAQEGRVLLLESRHEDNPSVTPEYLQKLDALTGVRYQRLRLGRWVAAEGIVYEGWDAALHRVDTAWLNEQGITEASPASSRARRFIGAVDWGFTNPGVIQVWALDGDDRLYCLHQVYRTKQTIDWWIEQAKALAARFPIEAFVADPSEPAYIEQFRRAEIMTVAGYNEVGAGIQAVAQRLVRAGDGLPRLFFARDSLAERDPSLVERKLPCSTEEEIDGYVWNLTAGRKKGEEPVKLNDHGCDALRYLVAYVDRLGRQAPGAVSRAGPPRRAR